MPRMKRDVLELRERGIDSLVLAVELFNRPHDQGRTEAVLLLLHHAHEMLLKAVIRDRTGTIHESGQKYSYSFDKCLEICRVELGVIDSDERMTLSILDQHRDTVAHFYLDMSEDLLYVSTQAAVTLFDTLLTRVFARTLADILPARVLPISTRPPQDMALLIDSELSQVDRLLSVGSRKGYQAAAKLRPVVAMAQAVAGDGSRVSETAIRLAVKRRRTGEAWSVIFPEVAALSLDTEGAGTPLYLRVDKKAKAAVRIAQPGDEVAGALLKQEINIWDKYNLGLVDLAKKTGVTRSRTLALVYELELQDDPECFKSLTRGASKFKGYSRKALARLTDALADGLDVEAVWIRQRHRIVRTKSASGPPR